MSIENSNNKPKTAENPHSDKVPSNNLNDIGRNMEGRGEKGAAPSSQTQSDGNKNSQEDKYDYIGDKNRREHLNRLEKENPTNEQGQQMVSKKKQDLLRNHLDDLKNKSEPNKAQTEKNSLKGDYGQKKPSMETQKSQPQEQSKANSELPGKTIPQEKYNQRQELIDRLCPHRPQNSDSSSIEEKSSNRF